MPDFFWFSDAQWARIELLLPTGQRGKRRVDDRPRSERDYPCAALWRPPGGLRGGVGAEKDALQPLCALGRTRHLGRHLQRLGRGGRRTGP